MPPPPPAAAAAPHAEDLERIGADAWAWLLPHLRAALHAVDEEQVPGLGRLRATPAVRFAGGRPRQELARLLARGGPLWVELHDRVASAADRPAELGWLLAGERSAPAPTSSAGPVGPAPHGAGEDPAERDRARESRLRDRAQRLQRERDDARRQLDGARARAERAEAERDDARVTIARLEAEVEELRAQLAEAADERSRAVERERRRGAAELDELRGELAALRRADEQRRADQRRRQEAEAAPAPPAPGPTGPARGHGQLVPGRPSRLPPGVRRGTREAVEALLHPDRFVLVDGYNLTLTQRDDLALEQQRQWALRSLATLVARRAIRPTIVFDSSVAGPRGRQERGRGVTVRFTAEGMTADDEIVFEVAAQPADRPIVVVTDDRELRERLDTYRVDLVRTAEFRWVLD